jgi:hypothetical protein
MSNRPTAAKEQIMLSAKDVFIDAATTRLLHAAGAQDAAKGVDKYSGWKVVAAECGYDPHKRTPAEEAYLDGWYSGRKAKTAVAPIATTSRPKATAPRSAPRWKAKPKKTHPLVFSAAEQRIFEEALSLL